MRYRRTIATLAAVAAFGVACATQQKLLAKKQDVATQTALERGRFELDCPSATGTVLSKDFIRPAVEDDWGDFGVERLEYTIGVAGCGKRTTYIVICQVGTETCFAANPSAVGSGD
jgi:hypothetical protein